MTLGHSKHFPVALRNEFFHKMLVEMATNIAAPDDVDTGDLVLFNRRCTRMSVFGAIVCTSAKLVTQSSWGLSHRNALELFQPFV